MPSLVCVNALYDVFVSEIVKQSCDGICVGVDWFSCIPYFMTSVGIERVL
jgi:hypothetical protein